LPPPRPAVVIPSGVECALFDAAAAPSPELAAVPRPIVLYIGRLAPQKDVPTLVRAFGLMRTPASLVIVGDGPDRARVNAAVAALPEPARSRVHRLGFRPHTEVPKLMAAAAVVALPSVYEEMGSVLVEALRSGVPVAASRIGGIPDVIRHGETGLLLPPQQPDRWAEALDGLIRSPETRARMQLACRRAADAYSWDKLSEQVLAVYHTAMSTRRAVAPPVAVAVAVAPTVLSRTGSGRGTTRPAVRRGE
jgi:glycosyltransferase involved in cell wall biosynthesis